MLQKPAHDGTHADVLRYAGNARAQHADAADDQIDLHAGAGGTIQRLDDLSARSAHSCLAMMRAGACASMPVSRSIFAATLRAGVNGDCSSMRNCGVRVRPVSCRKISCTSAPMASFAGQQAVVGVGARGLRSGSCRCRGGSSGAMPSASRRTTMTILACVLKPTTPYITCAPASCSRLARFDVGLLVEARAQFDDHRDVLADCAPPSPAPPRSANRCRPGTASA